MVDLLGVFDMSNGGNWLDESERGLLTTGTGWGGGNGMVVD